MKIAILSHFGSFQASYALHVGWYERAKLLLHFDQDFDFLVDKHCKEGLFPNQVNLPSGRVKTSRPIKERAEHFRDLYKEVLQPYDIILTADILYQIKANFLAYNQGMRWAAPHLKARWAHWIHSGWMHRPQQLPRYPQNLRWELPEPERGNHRIVYLNSWELNDVARMYNTTGKQVYCVYNPKDPRTFFDFSEKVCEIVKTLDLPSKDIVQIFPHSAERMDSKGIDSVIRVFSALKRAGARIAIIFANANSRSVQTEIANKKGWMLQRYNLVENEDYLFTSDIMKNRKPLPRKDVGDLFRMCNLFVFGSWRETVGNCFQEAKASGNLLVLNKGLPSAQEMGGQDAIFFESTHKVPGVRDGMPGDTRVINYHPNENEYFDSYAKIIIDRLAAMPPLVERWKFSWEWIWHHQFKDLIYGDWGEVK